MDSDFIVNAEKVLLKVDPALGKLIQNQQLLPTNRPTDYFAALCRSIIGQQVSVAAAKTIFERFENATNLLPANVLAINDETKKQIGLSRQKTAYLKDLARHFHNNPTVYEHLERASDTEVILELTTVKGVGTWTAQMFLMFTLQRPDVFAPDDGGLQRAMMLLYGWNSLPRKKELQKKAATWSPYRTIACMHLWQSLDT